MNSKIYNDSQKRMLIIGDDPFSEKPKRQKLRGYYQFGGVGRSIHNLVHSSHLNQNFICDLIDDNNNSSSILGSLYNSLSTFFIILQKLKKKKYDIVLLYCNSVSFAFIQKFMVALIVYLSSTKLFVRYGGSKSFQFFSKAKFNFFFHFFFSMQTGILVQGETGKNFYQRFKKDNIFIHSNFITNDFLKRKNERPLSNKLNVLLSTGPDYKRKGFLLVLDSIKNFEKKNQLNFLAVGCDSTVNREIKKRGLQDYIKKYPTLNYEEMECIIEKSHILLLPSFSEGMPNLILESMAKGLVIISTRVGSIADVLVPHENGFFVDVGSSKQITKSLVAILENNNLEAISAKNINKIKNSYGENVIVPRLTNFFLERL